MNFKENFDRTINHLIANYRSANFKAIFIYNSDGQKFLNSAWITFLSDDYKPSEKILDYGEVLFVEKTMQVEEARKQIDNYQKNVREGFFEGITENQKFSRFEQQDFFIPFRPVGDFRCDEWPTRIFRLESNYGYSQPDSRILIKKDQPFISNFSSFVEDWANWKKNRGSAPGGMWIMLPDYRCMIDKVRVFEKKVEIDIIKSKNNLQLFYAANVDDKNAQVDVLGNTYIINTKKPFISLDFVLLDEETNDIVEWAEIRTDWGNRDDRIEFKTEGLWVQNIISNGENETVEFKAMISGDKKSVIKTASAFANGLGGVFLVGVEDDGNICGCDVKKEENRLIEWFEKDCDPPVSAMFEKIKIGDKEILIVKIEKSKNGLHQLREDGAYYIRRGSTTRFLRDSEFTLYENRANF